MKANEHGLEWLPILDWHLAKQSVMHTFRRAATFCFAKMICITPWSQNTPQFGSTPRHGHLTYLFFLPNNGFSWLSYCQIETVGGIATAAVLQGLWRKKTVPHLLLRWDHESWNYIRDYKWLLLQVFSLFHCNIMGKKYSTSVLKSDEPIHD